MLSDATLEEHMRHMKRMLVLEKAEFEVVLEMLETQFEE